MGRLDNKVALITGVGSGIGKAAALLFAQAGAVVFGVDRDEAAGQTLTSMLSSQTFRFFKADLSTDASCFQTVQLCCAAYGHIDVLYNNAGISPVGGVIINTASELAIVAQPLYAAYCASKGAVLSLTRALALEYAQDNIRINALCPGPIDTPMLQQEFDQSDDPIQSRTAGIATMPIGRLGKPEEIAQVALFLASDAPSLMQGASIVVDGAKTIL